MPRSEPSRGAARRRDVRGWIILAWVVGCGLIYGKMVVEQRGGKLQGWINRIAQEVRRPAKS
jgi:hypothetical protein